MKKISSLVLLLAVLSIVSSQENKRCFDKMTLGTSETTFINNIKDSIANKETFEDQCLHILIERGYYKAAVILFEDYFLTNNIDLHQSTLKLTATQKKDFEKITQKIMSANTQVQQIEPALKWAQSEDHVFLHVKLSMRADSPACLNCKVEKVEITNSTLLMSVYGIQSHQPLRFYLDLSLFDEINPEASTWHEDSVGTLFFSLAKVHKVIASEEPVVEENKVIEDNSSTTEHTQNATNILEEKDVSQSEKTTNQQDNEPEKQEEQNKQAEPETSTQKQGESTEQPNVQEEEKNEGPVESGSDQPITTTTTTTTEEQKPAQPSAKESIANKIWLRLEKTERKKEFAIWWDMRDKYKNAMDEWDTLCAKEREGKKKRSKQEKQTTQQQQQQHQQQQEASSTTTETPAATNANQQTTTAEPTKTDL